MFNTKHRVAKLGAVLAATSLGLVGLTGIAPAQAADQTTTIKIHLDVAASDAQGWNLWYWGPNVTGAQDPATTPNFDQPDTYGVYTQFDITQSAAIGSLSGFPRTTEDWGTATKPFGDNHDGHFNDIVDGQVNEFWCHVADYTCSSTPNYLVRVHVNKLLADTSANWDVFNFGAGYTYVKPNVNSPATPGFTGVDSVDGTDTGSYASFEISPTDPLVHPSATLNDGKGPVLTNGIGIIVRGIRDDWGTKKTGDVALNFNDHQVGEVWCEVVDAANKGCTEHAPDPVTHVTIHINQPLDAANNYVVWDNHVTNNTDVLTAPLFTDEDRYGAISKFHFTDTSVKSVRFYITNGATFDSAKITGSGDMTVPINAFSGEVWCNVLPDTTASCTSSQPKENVTVTVHVNASTSVTSGWNVGYQSLGNPTDDDKTPNVVADGDNSVVTWTVSDIGISDKSTFEWLLRNKENWDSAAGGVHTPGDLIKPTGDNNLVANITGANVVIWCDATHYADPTYTDPPSANYLTPAVPLMCSQAPETLKVHYNRPLSSLRGGWEVAAFGTGVGGDTRAQFTGEDAYGAFAVIHYNPSVTDTSAISFVIRKFQPFVAATESTLQKNYDAWTCVDPMVDCGGGFFRQTTGNRAVPSGATEVWTLAGSTDVSDSQITDVPSNDVTLKTQLLGGGRVRVWATAGAGTTPTAIVIDALNRKGVSLKPGISCTIGKSKLGTNLVSYCNIKGLKKGVKYRFKAHALAYGIGSSAHSALTKPITVK